MSAFHDLPQSFRREQKELEQAGLDQWEQLRDLSDIQLSRLCRSGQASARNLKRLRAIAAMVCDLDLAPQDAALLMHAGIATRAALAGNWRLVHQTGRLERSLGTGRPAVVDLSTARRWIARQATVELTPVGRPTAPAVRMNHPIGGEA